MANSALFSKRVPSLFSANPAASSFFARPALSAEYESLYPSLSDGSDISRNIFVYSHRIKNYGFGAGFEEFSLDDSQFGKIYQEKTFLFNCSRFIGRKFFIGLNVRMLQKKYGEDNYTKNALDLNGSATGISDPVFNDGFSKTAYSADLGVSKLLSKYWSVSAAADYITSPDISLSGAAKRKPTFSLGSVFESKYFSIGSVVKYRAGDYWLNSGFEKDIYRNILKARAGLSTGSGNLRTLSVGAGYLHLKQFAIDYAYCFPFAGLKKTGGRHRFSISYLFGGVEEETTATAEVPEISDLAQTLRSARLAVEKKDWQKACNLAKKILEVSPENAEASGIYEKALSQMRSLSTPFSNDARKLLDEGRFADALSKYKQVLAINPENADFRKKAEKLKKVAKITPSAIKKDNVSYLIRKAVSAYLADDARLALNAIIYSSQIDKSRVSSALANMIKKEYPSKYREMKFVAGMNLVQQKLYSALKYIYDARYDLAIMECEDVLKLEPANVLALTRLGSAYYALGNKDKAVEAWKEALRYDPNNRDIRDFLSAPSGQSIKQLYEKRKSEKEEKRTTAKKFYLYGIAAKKRGEFARAEDFFNKVMAVASDDKIVSLYRTKSRRALAEMRKEKEKRDEENLKLMKIYFGNGMAYYRKGEFSKAQKEFEKILKIKPDHKQSQKMIDLCRKKMKNNK
ncbi:MAG: tetratricopeptide repeat protein [Elusimicrobia bacterium]|nr:tetratricopeptide repeat protein [Elusimicrobiota bacterium]